MKLLKTLLFFFLISTLLLAATPTPQEILSGADIISSQVVPTSVQLSNMPHIVLSSGSSTLQIQSAINTCSHLGGIVELQKGGYLCGPIQLKSGVYLQLDDSATLTALPYSDYPNNSTPQNFISAKNAHNFGIIGTGTINGNGDAWWSAFKNSTQPNNFKRPRLIYFQKCHDIYIANVTLKNSPSFHIVPLHCKNVVISHITINTLTPSPNTDGIDPASTTDMVIENSSISDGDDNIAIKAQEGKSQNIYIINNDFGLGHGLSIGAQTNSGVSHIYVLNASFEGTTTGFRIKSPFGVSGEVTYIYYLNTVMKNVATPFEISAYYPESIIPQVGATQVSSGASLIANHIYLSNLSALFASKNAMLIVGAPNAPFSDIYISNVNISSEKGAIIRNATLTTSHVDITTQEGPPYILENNGKILTQN